MSPVTELIVPRRFCGPPDSGNGGWTAGALATTLAREPADHVDGWPTIEVSLRQPPPLDTPLDVVAGPDDTATATFGGAVIATARLRARRHPDRGGRGRPRRRAGGRGGVRRTRVPPVPHVLRLRHRARGGRRAAHLPRSRGPDDAGGTVTGERRPRGRDLDAAPQRRARTSTPTSTTTPRASVAATWAALDCVGGWAGDLTERLMVLGRMTTRIDTLPVIGEEHVVVGVGRRRRGPQDLHRRDAVRRGPAGRRVGRAHLDRGRPGPLRRAARRRIDPAPGRWQEWTAWPILTIQYG